jgi:glycosyltransferase involved in cell wall biosynthesis
MHAPAQVTATEMASGGQKLSKLFSRNNNFHLTEGDFLKGMEEGAFSIFIYCKLMDECLVWGCLSCPQTSVKISVIIPAYNAADTIRETLDSVLGQTKKPAEILVFNDGSTDATGDVLKSYGSAITVFTQANGGLSRARNFLCGKASGEVIAFLDSDDVWHPAYLEMQTRLLAEHPEAAASFTRYVPFRQENDWVWPEIHVVEASPALLEPLAFFRRYNRSPLQVVPSCCCIPRRVLAEMGPEIFHPQLQGAEDFHLFNRLPIYGPVVLLESRLMGYRQTPKSLCSDRLRNTAYTLKALDLFNETSPSLFPRQFWRDLKLVRASRQRRYAKHLMGVRKPGMARQHVWLSLSRPGSLSSVVKSLGLYAITWLPRPLQPKWPAQFRD